MKKKYLKIILDIVMLFTIVLFYNKLTISMKFHEIGGLVVCGVFLIHIGLNFSWVKGVGKRLFSKKLPLKTRIGFIVNVLLLISFFAIALSGVMISKTILTEISSRAFNWRSIHYFASAATLILLGIHIGLHAGYMKAVAKKHIKWPKRFATIILAVFMILVVVFGVYNMTTSGFSKWLAIPFSGGAVTRGPSSIESSDRASLDSGAPVTGERSRTSELDDSSERTEHSKTRPETSSERPEGSTERPEGASKRPTGSPESESTEGVNTGDRSTFEKSVSWGNIVNQGALFGSIILAFAIFTAGIERLIKKPKGYTK